MPTVSRVAFIGNSTPRRCGISTFTNDLRQAVAATPAGVKTAIVAMTDDGQSYDYPPEVLCEIAENDLEDYVRAAEVLNAGGFDVVCLQHEFGIFGGPAGEHILTLLALVKAPVVTTLHTVLAEPNPVQRRVLEKIISLSAKIVVMAEKGRDLLRSVYRAPDSKIVVIPHGIPDTPFESPDAAKARIGLEDRAVILTFGLLSPNKGVEVMIDAMPAILRKRRDAVYVVVGATHPTLRRREGEAYRESLMARVRDLGVEDSVIFFDEFVDLPTLLGYIGACDIYVTPYLNEAQMTSGTLSYAFGLGKAVVSTPYWHASELLADGRGVLAPFGDAAAMGREIADLLTDDVRRNAMRARAYGASRAMTWANTAERYLEAFESARGDHRLKVVARLHRGVPSEGGRPAPSMRTHHFLAMCDDTGLFQHAVHNVPDRLHGYCVDDNARALLVACAVSAEGEEPLPDALSTRFAAFIQHAWNPDVKRFRNFMSFDRRWLEPAGSEDSHGRTLWALGDCARRDASPSRRRWAAALFEQAMGTVTEFTSPRAWAFTLLGLEAYLERRPADEAANALRIVLADRLMSLLEIYETPDWVWFENGLAYDNARLPQALIVTGEALSDPRYTAAGLRTLGWLVALQTTAMGHFRPVGSQSFGDRRRPPRAFDQQPLEACATIAACLAAWRADGDGEWRRDAERAFAWFLGANDLSTPLVDIETGSCRDGLHPDRANENRGGESVVSYLLALSDIRHAARVRDGRAKVA